MQVSSHEISAVVAAAAVVAVSYSSLSPAGTDPVVFALAIIAGATISASLHLYDSSLRARHITHIQATISQALSVFFFNSRLEGLNSTIHHGAVLGSLIVHMYFASRQTQHQPLPNNAQPLPNNAQPIRASRNG